MTEAQYFLIPGFSQAAAAWEPVLDALGDGGDIRALDIPTTGSFVETAHALAERRSGIWVGYSLGGRLALQIALDHPAAVHALVLVSTNPGIDDPQARAARRAEDERLADRVETEGVDAFLSSWLSQPMFAHLDPAAARRHRLDSPGPIAHQLRTLGQGAQRPLWDRLAELQMPVALVTGAGDERYSAISHRGVAAIGSNAQLHVVPEAGHNLPLEQPVAVAEVLSQFQ